MTKQDGCTWVRYAHRLRYLILGWTALPWQTSSYTTQWFRDEKGEIIVLI